MKIVFLYLLFLGTSATAQTYTSYFTGHVNDTMVSPLGGICMMGGSTEHDEAMKWFLQRCNGGDVLVLRASGSNGYNDYLYNQLGIPVHSVETIVCNSANASNEQYVQHKIMQAEGIWFAGGDQWDYVSYWRNTPIDSLINLAIQNRNIVIGGTSAGMAILGGYYFSAQNGTVTSAAALANPYNNKVKVDSASFLHCSFLDQVITDTHYDNPDRRGRQITFLSRILTDWGVEAKGIACDEYTAVCIDIDGIAHVYGDYPSSDDNAYFILTNCELESRVPEECTNGNPLTWNLDGTALKVYKVKGTFSGINTFNLNDWKSGSGGEWQNWYVTNGSLSTSESDRIHCQSTSVENQDNSEFEINIYPNPCPSSSITIEMTDDKPRTIEITDFEGRVLKAVKDIQFRRTTINAADILPGMYFVRIQMDHRQMIQKIIIY